MILDIKNFEIKGVKLFNIKINKDKRGSFSEVFKSDLNYSEFKIKYVQENESISNYGVFRGMHLQKDEYSQSKLIRVVQGKIIDVVCDLRRSSSSFKKIILIKLVPNQILFLPKGLAHGFLTLEKKTILNYKCDKSYNKNSETGFNLFKSVLDHSFPIGKEEIYMSIKDKSLPSLKNSYIYENL